MLPLSRRIAVSANVIFFPCTRLEIKFILSHLILDSRFLWGNNLGTGEKDNALKLIGQFTHLESLPY